MTRLPNIKSVIVKPQTGKLPQKFDSKLVKLVNESVYNVRAFALMRKPDAPTQTELATLGEMVFAELTANVFLLYAAWFREAHEGYSWDEKTLTSQLSECAKTFIALALRDVDGQENQRGWKNCLKSKVFFPLQIFS